MWLIDLPVVIRAMSTEMTLDSDSPKTESSSEREIPFVEIFFEVHTRRRSTRAIRCFNLLAQFLLDRSNFPIECQE